MHSYIPASIDYAQLQTFIEIALNEDIGSGDVSSMSSIPELNTDTAMLLVKEEGILAGLFIAQYIFDTYASNNEFTIHKQDGDPIKLGDIVFTVQANTRDILKLERITLNLMQRLSGVATQTSALTQNLLGTQTRLLDTRKTTPHLRFLEKWAVTVGGGHKHRSGLYDMIMLKDNHVDAAGGIRQALEDANGYRFLHKLDLQIEVETRSLVEVMQVLEIGLADRIMLDNFTVSQAKAAVDLINGRVETEISGGITIHNIREYGKCGATFISSSSMTHSVKSLDMSLKIQK